MYSVTTHKRLRDLAKSAPKKDEDAASTHSSECSICLMSIAVSLQDHRLLELERYLLTVSSLVNLYLSHHVLMSGTTNAYGLFSTITKLGRNSYALIAVPSLI